MSTRRSAQFAETMKTYGITHAKADRFAGVWVVEAFARHGVQVEQSAAPKSELYLAFLPLVTAKRMRTRTMPQPNCSVRYLSSRDGSGSSIG